MDDEPYSLLRKPEMADRLSISLRTLEMWMNQRVVPFIKVRGTILFDPREVFEALKRREFKAVGTPNRGKVQP